MKPLRALLLRNTVVTWLSYCVGVLASLVLVPPLLRSVGADVYGAWVFVFQLTAFAVVFDLGVQPAVTKMVAEALGRGDRERVRRVVGTAFTFHTGMAVAVLGVFAALSPILAGGNRMGGVEPAELLRAYGIAALGAALAFPAAVFAASLKGALRLDLVGWGNVASQGVRAAGFVWVIRSGEGVTALALVALASNVANLVFLLVALLVLRRLLPLSPRSFSAEVVGGVARFGLFSLLGQAGWYMAYGSNAVLIGFLLTPADVAYYGIVGNVMALLSGIAGALTGNMMPLVAGQLARGELENSRKAYLLSTRFTLMLVLPIVTVLIALGPDLMTLWLGPRFGGPAGVVLQILALAYLFPVAGGAAPQVILGAGQERRMARISLFEGVLAVSVSLVLIRLLGLVGAAIGTLVSATIVHAVLWPLAVRARLDFKLRVLWQESVRPTLGPLLAALPVLTLGLLARGPGRPWIPLVAAPATIAVYGAVAWFTCFNAEERAYWLRFLGLTRKDIN